MAARILITGADGFVGRAVARALPPERLRLVDRRRPDVAGAQCIAGDLTDRTALPALLDGIEAVIHLAALPGGAAEADPAASRAVNLDAALNLIEAASGRARFVYASSIAVFGPPLPDRVDDDTPPCPAMTYGAHKLMVETALADAIRRGDIEGIALRLPGIVARPPAPSGLKSAFMSDLFWAIRDGRPYVVPVSSEATIWLMSASRAAANLVHALAAPSGPALTLPALRTTIGDLVETVAKGRSAAIAYAPDPVLEAKFGRQPPLATPRADRDGFRRDDDLSTLVQSVWSLT
ncbi:MAG TPA: NAD-dependent epimerase/dehydratase family protein [Allosphingosinicella sp.]|nr:NAD-dependent epimerase/dehydratase family protein [Allosphingosinicella sp.]